MTRIVFFYLTSFGTSLLGNSITAIALPLLVLFTTGSPLGAGAVAIAAAVPAAVAGLLMGSLVDRINRRTAAVLSDLISAAALLILPIVDLTVGLNLGWFIAVAVLNSFGDVPGITAREAMLPAVARAAGMDPSRLIGLRESLAGVSLLVGPAIAGILVASLEPVAVMWVTSGIAALAALLTLVVPSGAATLPGAQQRDSGSETPGSVFDGLVVIFRTPLLRVVVLLGLALAVVLAATQGMVIPVHFAFQDEVGFIGFVLSALAAGLLVGGGLFAGFGTRIPRRRWFVTGVVVVAVGFVVIGILGPVWSIFAGAAIVGLGGGCMNAVVGLTFVENVADAQRGKVLGAQNAIMTLVPSAGIGAAALLIEVGSLHLATTALVLLWIGAATLALLSPSIRRLGQVSSPSASRNSQNSPV
ncbi:MFS transporter [Rhodococcus rhodnii]|uniref:Multidrug efflux pump Tap n=2 Tax=Rhodococcus rhodnii TaxID=38312 RepID=R7WPZ8_9NOCA|nr:MFS transporter [Rhodococcus rhodnii]EOM77396.1 major facilitator superfamily multidrug [Rhodococcus rhodnii LMG 5362]TXG90644.1 MFS transporter [Rhodococcus rhodnii]